MAGDRAALFAKLEERRAFTREHSRWGLLPPQREGLGLVLSVLSVLSLVAVFVALVAGAGSGWFVLLLFVALVTNLINISRTKKWLIAQLNQAA